MSRNNSPERMLHPQEQQPKTIPSRHKESLVYTHKIAGSVPGEVPVRSVESINGILPEPGAYFFKRNSAIEEYRDIKGAKFELERETLSGRVDSAHAVLPGLLTLEYADGHKDKSVNIAAKGYYKRLPYEKMERVRREVAISHLMGVQGEIAFEPLAVVIAPAVGNSAESKEGESFDILLITKLERSAQSLDNIAWNQGYNRRNLTLADNATAAMARAHSMVGIMHGDLKIKNFVHIPTGLTSVMDFETSEPIDKTNPASVAGAVQEDMHKFLTSLEKANFFFKEPQLAKAVLERLADTYLYHWQDSPDNIQTAVYNQTVQVIENVMEIIELRAVKEASKEAAKNAPEVTVEKVVEEVSEDKLSAKATRKLKKAKKAAKRLLTSN